MNERVILDVRDLGGCSRLSPGVCAYLGEAASVVLGAFHAPPPPPTPAALFDGEAQHEAGLVWRAPDPVQRGSHANELEVVRDGACAVAIAAVHAHAGYLVRKRPRHGSGADYLMTRIGDEEDHFVRLEVSGTARGDALEMRARIAEKRAQLRAGREEGPAIGRRVQGRCDSHGGRMSRDMFDDPRSQEADDLSLQAELLERRGELAAARELYGRAAGLEEALARETPGESPRVRGVLAISAVSLWAAAGALARAIGLADEFLADAGLTASARGELGKLAEELRARAAREHHNAVLATLMESWLRREPSGPDFDPDALERVRIEAA